MTQDAAPRRDRDDPERPPLADPWSVALVTLAAMLPFATFLQGNAANLVDPWTVVRVGGLWMAVALALFAVVRLLTRDRSPLVAAAGVAAFELSFWNYGRWLTHEASSPAVRWTAFAVWALVTAIAVVLAVRLVVHPAVRSFVVIFLGILIVFSIVGFSVDWSARSGGDPPGTYSGPAFAPFVERPNVYWFVFDEHARGDQLRRWTGRDTTWFDEALVARGFSVSTSSTAAYPHTHLSIPSTLEMAYPFTPGHDYRGEYADAATVLAGDNPVAATFEANGYELVYAPEGSIEWSFCPEPTDGRSCIEPIGGPLALREPITQLVELTPLAPVELPIRHNDQTSVLDGLAELGPSDAPRFVFAHILSPHLPHRYNADCSLRDEWVFGRNFEGAQRAKAYADDVECVDHQFVQTVDTILATDPDAVIIVQSDHGSRLTFDWSKPYAEWSDDNLAERFGAVNAMRLPGPCRDRSIEGLNLVNTFRLVFACLDGTEPDLLENRTYFTEFGRMETLVEVPPDRLPPG